MFTVSASHHYNISLLHNLAVTPLQHMKIFNLITILNLPMHVKNYVYCLIDIFPGKLSQLVHNFQVTNKGLLSHFEK